MKRKIKAPKIKAPNYREISKQECCDNCAFLDWDKTENWYRCYKYKIDYVFGDNVEYDMICDSYVMWPPDET